MSITSHPLTNVAEVEAIAAFCGTWDGADQPGVPAVCLSNTGVFEWEDEHLTVTFDLGDPFTLAAIDDGTVLVTVDVLGQPRRQARGPIRTTAPLGPWDPHCAGGIADAVRELVGEVFATTTATA